MSACPRDTVTQGPWDRHTHSRAPISGPRLWQTCLAVRLLSLLIPAPSPIPFTGSFLTGILHPQASPFPPPAPLPLPTAPTPTPNPYSSVSRLLQEKPNGDSRNAVTNLFYKHTWVLHCCWCQGKNTYFKKYLLFPSENTTWSQHSHCVLKELFGGGFKVFCIAFNLMHFYFLPSPGLQPRGDML